MYTVRSISRVHPTRSYTYVVTERSDGALTWGFNYPHELTPAVPTDLNLPRTGSMLDTPVAPEEAILVTGLDHPMAALDQLRELVHAAT
jgi:hypothetical protein